jgi:hypothetical protein
LRLVQHGKLLSAFLPRIESIHENQCK